MMNKQIFKKDKEELQQYLQLFKRRGSKIEPKKGKGSYTRKTKYRKSGDYFV